MTGSSEEVDADEDRDESDDVSRMENRSIDVLVDDDGGAQLIAYSVFEQVGFKNIRLILFLTAFFP